MIERRKYPRATEFLTVNYKVVKMPDVESNTVSKNISAEGMCFPCRHKLEPGTVLELNIYIRELKEHFEVTGEVVWLRPRKDVNFPFVVGVKFIDIDPLKREKILNYIKDKTAKNNSQ